MIVYIKRIVRRSDLRSIHSYRKLSYVQTLKQNEVVVLVNNAENKIRVIDATTSCYNIYLDGIRKGLLFDLDVLEDIMSSGLGVSVKDQTPPKKASKEKQG